MRVANSDEVRSERLARSYGLDDTRSWVDPNGRRLSDRVWLARKETRRHVDDTLRRAIAEGTDALKVADSLEVYLRPELRPLRNAAGELVPGQAKRIVTQSPNVRRVLGSLRPFAGSFPARRLARTEITRAHGAATIWAAERNPFTRGVTWLLSGNHPEPDVCDQHAGHDSGLGRGVYAPNAVPRYPNHPQDRCTLAPAVVEDADAVVDQLRRDFGLGEP